MRGSQPSRSRSSRTAPAVRLAPALALSYADTLARLRRTRRDLGLLITESTPKLLEKIVDVSLTIERGEVN